MGGATLAVAVARRRGCAGRFAPVPDPGRPPRAVVAAGRAPDRPGALRGAALRGAVSRGTADRGPALRDPADLGAVSRVAAPRDPAARDPAPRDPAARDSAARGAPARGAASRPLDDGAAGLRPPDPPANGRAAPAEEPFAAAPFAVEPCAAAPVAAPAFEVPTFDVPAFDRPACAGPPAGDFAAAAEPLPAEPFAAEPLGTAAPRPPDLFEPDASPFDPAAPPFGAALPRAAFPWDDDAPAAPWVPDAPRAVDGRAPEPRAGPEGRAGRREEGMGRLCRFARPLYRHYLRRAVCRIRETTKCASTLRSCPNLIGFLGRIAG